MLLKSVELQGFKTFPEKTNVYFDKGITAIVGPNGSGKSNISDAIRWVLGEQSNKVLRCSKMEDIIFSGTPNRNSKGFAQVTLVIENIDRQLPFDLDEVTIKRRYYRSGESEYLINGNVVRLKDINELFMDTGLGKDGYSVISQGKIDSIVASKSEERREIFEEAAGISKYRYKKIEAERKLAKAEENLIRLNDIVNELSARVGPLFEQSKKAKEYLSLSNECKTLQIGIWLGTLDKSGILLKQQDDKLSAVKNQYEELETEIENVAKETEDALKRARECTVLLDEKRRTISVNEESSIRKTGEISVLENDILHNEENIKKISLNIKDINDSFLEFDKNFLQKQDKLSKLKVLETNKKNLLDDIKLKILNINKEIEVFEKKIKQNEQNNGDINKDISNKQVFILTAKSDILNIDSRLKLLKNEKINSENQLEIENTNSLKCKLDKDELNKKIALLKSGEEKTNEHLQKKQKEIDLQKKTVENLFFECEGKKRKIQLLESLEQNLEGFSLGVKNIMDEAKKGTLKGICGPVSSIIDVPKIYADAIETAISFAMQNIVVDNEDDAKKAIDYLKRKNIGRATFLPITTIKGKVLSSEEMKSCNGFIGIASELCTSADKYHGILNYVLGRVAVVDNIDNAVTLAKEFFYKFKVVTLDGQIVNAGGSLTGGAKGKSSGVLTRRVDIETNKKLIAELKNKLKTEQVSLESLVDEEKNLKINLHAQQQELRDNYNKVMQYKSENSNCEYRINLLKNAIEKNINDVQDLCKQKETFQNDMLSYNSELTTLLDKVKAFDNANAETKVKANDLKLIKEKTTQELNDLNLELLAVQKDIEQAETMLQTEKINKEARVQQVNLLNDEINSLTEKNKHTVEMINELKNDIVLLKESVGEADKQIIKINDERMEFEKKTVEFRNLERDKSNEKEKISLEVARLEEKRDRFQIEYDEIISKLWDEYELTRREATEQFSKIESTATEIKRLNEIRLKIRNMGTVNVAAIDEYKEISARYEFLKGQVDDVEKSKKELYKLIVSLTVQMKKLFRDRFTQINENFNLVFNELFAGGKAQLRLVDDSDVLNTGIEILVQPPGKIVSHLEALSGGEKAFVSIALYFAIMKVNPAPFCVMDEIEAALDEVNVNKFAAYLKKMNDKTQFIVISHRRGTMEEADVLYGITMQNEGVSKLLELKATEFEQKYIKG